MRITDKKTMPNRLGLVATLWTILLVYAADESFADYRYLNSIGNSVDSNNEILNTVIKYIDYESGSDYGKGTRDDPWKHHPWDINSKGNSVSSKNVRTYIFKKGVIYRGTLYARESGSFDAPVMLTVESEWGKGKAVISGAKELSGGWGVCEDKYTQRHAEQIRNNIWCMSVSIDTKPQLVWVREDNHSIRIPIARHPNWKIVNVEDPRSGWFILSDVIIELVIELEQAAAFNKGETISVEHNRNQPLRFESNGNSPVIEILDVKANQLRVEVKNWHKQLLRAGDKISNGKVNVEVNKIKGTHSILRRLVDKKNLSTGSAGSFKGATVWAERRSMPKADAALVIDSDQYENTIKANFHRPAGSGPMAYDRYYLEGLPEFLDSEGEYYYYKTGENNGVLQIRLPGDENPNQKKIEIAERTTIIKIINQSNIVIDGLTFQYSNQVLPGSKESRHATLHAAAVMMRGDINNIKIINCEFNDLPAAIVAQPNDITKPSVIDTISIIGNRFTSIDGAAVAIGNGINHFRMKNNGSRVIHVDVIGNEFKNVGYRTLAQYGTGSHGDAIQIAGGEVVEVANNRIEDVWGSGISVKLGSEYNKGNVERPFLRSMMHNNIVVNSLLGAQDGGGINSWMGGPAYIYNNVSGNPVGCMYSRYITSTRKNWYRRGCYGVGIYLDGQYKSYVFNNIVWGKNNDVNARIYNSTAFNEAMGFMNIVFHNTFYRFGIGLHKGMFQHNRNYYLANLFIDMGLNYIQHEPRVDTIDYATLAFSYNQFYDDAKYFGSLGNSRSDIFNNIESWKNAMKKHGLMSYKTGDYHRIQPVRDSDSHEFTPSANSPVINAGVKVFVPWALYRVVGEWHFLGRNSRQNIINGENIFMNEEWVDRDMFHLIPRNDLECNNTDKSDFEDGILENWTPGSLRFDGVTRYCTLVNHKLASTPLHGVKDHVGNSPPGVRKYIPTDIGKDNFILELVVNTEIDTGTSGLVEKRDGRGYSLEINPEGYIMLTLDYGEMVSRRASSVQIADDQWHHVLIEVDRARPYGISIFVDGQSANGGWFGVPMRTDPLSNDAEFTVGQSTAGKFKGRLDFLRMSMGTLTEAETTIEELYEWEFNGPFLRDANGRMSIGPRDVGALEYHPE